MNHHLWTAVGSRVLALTFVIAGAAACGDRLADTHSKGPSPSQPSPSAVVIGQAPAEPLRETPETTAPAGARGEVGKVEDSVGRPKEGDSNSHSSLAPDAPLKAEAVDAQQLPERKTQ